MKRTTLGYLINEPDHEILLAKKKRGFAAGKLNGFGGKHDPGETDLVCLVREAQEELEIEPLQPELVAAFKFYFPHKPEDDHSVKTFLSRSWNGTPVETDELKPVWVSLSAIPYELMWADDYFWLPAN